MKDKKNKLRHYVDRWKAVKEVTMTTIGKDTGSYPTSDWKFRLLISEHSPIRKLIFGWKWYGIKRWVSGHIARHKFGVEHWVGTQRSDRTGFDRDKLPQDAPTDHEIEANAQAVIHMSQKRLCVGCASPETREAWTEFLKELKPKEPELVKCCVPSCVYRGGCPEIIMENKCMHYLVFLNTSYEDFEGCGEDIMKRYEKYTKFRGW